MARILITCSNDGFPFDIWKDSSAFLLHHSAELTGSGKHVLTDDPEEADLILFAEMGVSGQFAETVRAHPLYSRFPKKCFVFDSGDYSLPTVPGVYASLSKDQYRLGYTRTGFYLYLIENAFITHRPFTGNEKYLASFVGSEYTHPVRRALFEFQRSDIYVKDTSGYSKRMMFHGGPEERATFWSEYADSIADAKFSLCPRGRGPGSIRLFESMKMGRACVIVSDAWQPNDGIAWDDFSLTVPESQAHLIPEIMERNEHRAAEMGAHARKAWEENFSEQARFRYVVDLCLDIQKNIRNGPLVRTARFLRQVGTPRHFRRYGGSKMILYRSTGKIYW